MRIFKLIFLTLIFTTVLFSQQKYELESIEFEGNNSFSDSRLSEVIYSEETPWFFWQFINSIISSLGAEPVYFDSSNISIDINSLQQFYNTNGFFEATFDYKYNLDTTDNEATLTFIINENDPSVYGDINFTGLQNVDSVYKANFEDEFSIDTTERFEQQRVQQEVNSGVNLLLNNGYMFAQFDSTIVHRDTLKNIANLDIFITSGKKYRIDTVYVNKEGPGSKYVSEDLLRKLTGIERGDLYNLDRITRSQIRLYRTGLFNSVLLSSIEEDTAGHLVPLRLTGNIGLMNELSPELIVNNQQNAFNAGLGATYIRRNFLGEARKLTVGASFGLQDIFNVDFGSVFNRFGLQDTTLLGYIDSRITIEQPYLFGKPIFGIWQNYATVNKQRRYGNTLYGSKITFEFELPAFTFINYLSTSYNIERSEEIYYTNNDSLSKKLISVISADMRRTTANDILFPTQGYNISLHLEEANSLPYAIAEIGGNDFDGALFYKAVLTGSYYYALSPDQMRILATKLKVGHLQTYEGDYAGIPINRTFYTGGSNSVRGWRSNELPGQNVKGLTKLIEGSVEYRHKFVENFGAAVFFDYGNVWLNWDQVRWDDFAVAVGFGFRYYTSVAPFRLDFGFKFYDPADNRFIFDKQAWDNFEFHFGIGEAF